MDTTSKNAPAPSRSHACEFCSGSQIVDSGTQAGSACCCHPAWATHFEVRRADIIAGMDGFSSAEVTTHNPFA